MTEDGEVLAVTIPVGDMQASLATLKYIDNERLLRKKFQENGLRYCAFVES